MNLAYSLNNLQAVGRRFLFLGLVSTRSPASRATMRSAISSTLLSWVTITIPARCPRPGAHHRRVEARRPCSCSDAPAACKVPTRTEVGFGRSPGPQVGNWKGVARPRERPSGKASGHQRQPMTARSLGNPGTPAPPPVMPTEKARFPDGWLESDKSGELVLKRTYREFVPVPLPDQSRWRQVQRRSPGMDGGATDLGVEAAELAELTAALARAVRAP